MNKRAGKAELPWDGAGAMGRARPPVVACAAMWITLGVIAAVLSAGLGLLLYVTLDGGAQRAEVLARGEAATATILDYAPTGMAHGRNDTLRFHLEVRPAGGPPFEALADRLLEPGEAPLFAVGQARPVKFLRDGTIVRVELL